MKTDRTPLATKGNLFDPGQTLGGRYQVISCLGRGGMGVVYHVNQVFLNKEQALKTIETHGISDELMHRFQKEARTAFAVKHPNVIAVDDFGLLDDQTPFLVMELIRGETLSEKLKRTTSLPLNEAIPMFLQICYGLGYAHELGIVHRDIKPSNIMIPDDVQPGTEGSVKIVDFGIATFAPEDSERSLTHTTDIFGSPLYISPEQCSGGRIDHRADIYSLGCVIFETLTGTPPFIGDTALTTMLKHKSETAPSLREASLGKAFPKELEQIVATMLAKSPEQRYQNMGAVAKDLAATMRGDAIAKRVAPPSVKEENTVSPPLLLSRAAFFGIILLTTLMSATAAGFAAFQIKHFQMEQPVIQVARDKTDAKVRAEDIVLPIDDDAVEKVQDLTPQILTERLARADADGRLAMHFKTLKREQIKLMANAKWIHFLDLEESILSNNELGLFSKLPHLTQICVRGTNFNDDGAAALAKCKSLFLVSAGGTSLTDKGLAALVADHKILRYLDLNSISITDESMKTIGTLKNLRHLALQNTRKITDTGIKYIAKCPLDYLALSQNPNITDESCKTIAEFPSLGEVFLSKTNVTSKGLQELCKSKSLREVWVDGCKMISFHDIDNLKNRAPGLIIHGEKVKPQIEQDQ